jgi:gas vesicle protein
MESGCFKFVDIVQELVEEIKDRIEERLNNTMEQVQSNKERIQKMAKMLSSPRTLRWVAEPMKSCRKQIRPCRGPLTS